MFGALLDAAMSIPRNMQMEEDRNQRQQDAWGHTFNDQAFTREMTSATQAWNKEMADTVHQREVKDLRAAGLNPILSAHRGAPAPVTSAAMASSGRGGTGGNPGTAASNLQQGLLASAQEKLAKEQAIVATQQGWNVSADTERKKQETNLLLEQIKTQEQLTNSARSNANMAAEDEKGRALEGEIDETTYGKIMRYINRGMRGLTGGASAYRNLRE